MNKDETDIFDETYSEKKIFNKRNHNLHLNLATQFVSKDRITKKEFVQELKD